MANQSLLKQIREHLVRVYGPRLLGVVLYGSEARNQSSPDSDIDILVLLEGPVVAEREIEKIVDALYPVQLEVIRPLHATPADIRDYEAGSLAVYRNARRDGILV